MGFIRVYFVHDVEMGKEHVRSQYMQKCVVKTSIQWREQKLKEELV